MTTRPPSRFRTRLARSGTALIDIVVATVLLGICLAAMITIVTRALSSQTDGEQIQTAANLIDEQLNLVLMRGADSYASRYSAEGVCDPPFDSYRYHLDISGGTSGTPYLVRCTVFWPSALGERSAAVETLIAPRLGDNPDPDRTPTETLDRNALYSAS